MSSHVNLVWMRRDLRLGDQPALRAALEVGGEVVPVFIWSPEDEHGEWALGGAARWWLHQSLQALQEELGRCGSRLVIRRGAVLDELRAVVRESGAKAIFWNRAYEPEAITRDREVKRVLGEHGLFVANFNGFLLREPWEIRNRSGHPYQVFTPFWRACLNRWNPEPPWPAPRAIPAPRVWPRSESLEALPLNPAVDWAGGMRAAWTPGEAGARANCRRFFDEAYSAYSMDRNRPDLDATSRLSPHLHFGEISVRQIWHAFPHSNGPASEEKRRRSRFLAEIGWREFAHHLLYHFPESPTVALRSEFIHFPWRENEKHLRAWQRGRTGYPIVDAGMRQLWQTGWMHNRVRMIVASFLTKDLLLPWQEGTRWFWDTLVDADLANNTLGWQWTAGCGADAAPFFRVFNPVLQGKKYDPDGNYVRRFVPELAHLPAPWIHRPWEAPEDIRRAAGLRLGRDYPEPIVDHGIARNVALEAYQRMKTGGKK